MMLSCKDFLIKHGFTPITSITNFLTIKTGSADNSQWLFEKLLDKGVIIRPLSSNEMPDFVRISMGTETEMQHFYQSFESLLPNWPGLRG